MRLYLTTYCFTKRGNTEDECEDAISPYRADGEYEIQEFSCAVADGATESLLSGPWARILVEFYRKCPVSTQEINWFHELASNSFQNWKKYEYFPYRIRTGKPVQWYEEPGLEEGAYSSLLGLTFFDSSEGDRTLWRTLAVGDTCLFHVRANKLLAAFPIEHPAQFTNRPVLIGSSRIPNSKMLSSVVGSTGECFCDDTFYLMTDALAAWFLWRCEVGDSPWEVLRDFGTDEESLPFKQWIEFLRDKKEIRNDDVTLARIDIL